MEPYIAYSNETLARLPDIFDGDLLVCLDCHEAHKVYGILGTNGPDAMYFFKCDGRTKLVGIDGKCILGIPPDLESGKKGPRHEICNACWLKREPNRKPARLRDQTGTCCYCGGLATGIMLYDRTLNCVH